MFRSASGLDSLVVCEAYCGEVACAASPWRQTLPAQYDGGGWSQVSKIAHCLGREREHICQNHSEETTYDVKIWFGQLQKMLDIRTEALEVTQSVFAARWTSQVVIVWPVVLVGMECDDVDVPSVVHWEGQDVPVRAHLCG